MKRIITLISTIILLQQVTNAQIKPGDGSILNYRLIGFSFPLNEDASSYRIEIAAGNYNSEDSFRQNIVTTQHGKTNKIMAEVPFFGKPYTWRVVYSNGISAQTKSALYHFTTNSIPEVDTSFLRLRVTKHATKYKDAYVFMEANKVLYDMNGNPVWYMPLIEGKSIIPTDLKLSPQGTITFLSGDAAFEINYDGAVLWRTPDNSKIAGQGRIRYHHEFTKMNNGHYMVLAMNLNFSPQARAQMGTNTGVVANDGHISAKSTENSHPNVPFGKIIEYDEKGTEVWSWESSKYYEESDLKDYVPPVDHPSVDMHENSFYFDEKDKVIYLSCKGISRIIKIKYPEGTVLNSYGEKYKTGSRETGNGLFCGQHSVSKSHNGCVFLFNNNSCQPGAAPKIKKLVEPTTAQGNLAIAWKYDCIIEDSTQKLFPTGGNVVELADESIFASTGGSLGKTFIVSPDKEILWSALPERWNESEKKWFPFGQYRSNIIENRDAMEHLIWGAGINYVTEIRHNDIRSKPIAGAIQ